MIIIGPWNLLKLFLLFLSWIYCFIFNVHAQQLKCVISLFSISVSNHTIDDLKFHVFLSFSLSVKYYIFTVSRGPFIEEFYQCVTYGSYSAPWQEQLYTTFTLVFMFIIPLSILVLTYVSTFKTIAGKPNRESENLFSLSKFYGRSRERLNCMRLTITDSHY